MISSRPAPLRFGALLATSFAIVALAGCSLLPPSDPEPREPAESTEPAEEAGDSALEDEDIDLLAKITTDAPPEDLAWSLPTSLPDGWELNPAEDEPGVVQVNVSPSCIIDFRQPAGMGDDEAPDSAQVANDVAEELGEKAFDLELEVTPEKPAMIAANVNGGAMTAQLSFARVTFTAPSAPELSGTTYALRSGDFALIASAMCGGGEYASQGKGMEEFVEAASASVTY